MKNLFKILVLFLCGISMLSCRTKTDNLPEDAILDLRHSETPAIEQQAKALWTEADNILMRSNWQVELYMKDSPNADLRKVENFDSIPSNLVAVYNVIRNVNGDIFYVAAFPYSKTGEYENVYESIFDEAGNLLLFVRQSSFDVVYEKSEYFYNLKHELIKKTYLLTDTNDKPMPPQLKIKFNYRFPYEQYKTRSAWLKAHGLKK